MAATGAGGSCRTGISGDTVAADYRGRPEFRGGRIVKVVFDVADDAYLDVERHLAAAIARD